MAKPKTFNGTKLLVQIGDGASPEVFTHSCLINASRQIQFTSDTNDFVVPDCADPDAPGFKERVVDGLGAEITGAGVAGSDLIEALFDWWKTGDSKNIRVAIDVPTGDGGGYWSMAAKLPSFSVSGDRSQKGQFECSILSDGVVAWVDAA